jgi:hypothetical protein
VTPDARDRFTFGSILATKMVSALLDGLPEETIEHAAAEGLLSFYRLDEYTAYEPGPRPERSFTEFQASVGPGADVLPTVYEALGLPKPDPSKPIHADDEEMLTRFVRRVADRSRTGVHEVRVTMAKATKLVPERFLWLGARFLEHRSVNGIVEGFERFLASRGLAPAPTRSASRDRLRRSLRVHASDERARRRVGRQGGRGRCSAGPMRPRPATAADS